MNKKYFKLLLLSIFLNFYVNGIESEQKENIPLKDGERIKIVYRKK